LLIANHDNHHYISGADAGVWMVSRMGFRGKGLKMLLDRSFPKVGMGWMSQTRVGLRDPVCSETKLCLNECRLEARFLV